MTPGGPAGNVSDKYGTRNPVARALVARWRATLEEMIARVRPGSILDAGCGEGVLTRAWAARWPAARVVGLDVDDPALRAAWAEPGPVDWVTGRAEALPFAARSFDLVCAIELLEHVADPDAVAAELARCAARHVLVSVPREPLWRALNLARGAHWRTLGDTPGHVGHFARRDIVRLLERHGDVLAVRSPVPWTVVLVGRR